jgi:multidrug efflux pump subunit AcrA (membrane-fusion protein)
MKLKLFLILVLVVAGGGAIFVSMGGLAGNDGATTYLTSEATVGDVTDDVAATGAIETVASYGLRFGSAAHLVDNGSSAQAGTGGTWPVESVDVAVGDAVTQGDLLATASATDLQSELSGAIAGRRSAALQLEIAQEQLDDASGTDGPDRRSCRSTGPGPVRAGRRRSTISRPRSRPPRSSPRSTAS